MDIGEARRMGRALMDEHGPEDWRLVVDRAKKRAGVCRAAERTIGLSGPLTALHSPEQVRDTVLHEIAHALVGPPARPRAEVAGDGQQHRSRTGAVPAAGRPERPRRPGGHLPGRPHHRPAPPPVTGHLVP
uniref:SprT-like domain-containing protein n=1 Tax=Janibacter limosus TaxID=53458 RepID=A0AC61U3T1_9MICO|nr:SprT-like domain-containing protein [Janibacter limosus]